MKSQANAASNGPEFDFLRPPISLSRFIKQMGITNITAWRWRNDGKLRTVNICGRVYVTAEEVANFNRRASAGEFAKEHKTPAPGSRRNADRVKRNSGSQTESRRAA